MSDLVNTGLGKGHMEALDLTPIVKNVAATAMRLDACVLKLRPSCRTQTTHTPDTPTRSIAITPTLALALALNQPETQP